METSMRVAKWGNSLAIRLPKAVVDALDIKEGDEIGVSATAPDQLAIARYPDLEAHIAALRRLRGSAPMDFRFDRDEANER